MIDKIATSIIIPAHNEASVIGRQLGSITKIKDFMHYEIIVVCNGCSDNTADVARSFGDIVKVIETGEQGKTVALNIGDNYASYYPRVYVDADIILPATTLRLLVDALSSGEHLAASPSVRNVTDGASWLVRAYYRVHEALPYSKEGFGYSGVYGLSEVGRKRFSAFPAVINDDAFIKSLFLPSERKTITGKVDVFVPLNLKSLVSTKTRWHLGNKQLKSDCMVSGNSQKTTKQYLLNLSKDPKLWADILSYMLIALLSRISAWRMRGRSDIPWKRDESTRNIPNKS